MIAESLAAYHLEFNIPDWFVSFDLRIAFDRLDHSALFESIRHCGLPDGYIALLQQLYADQHGSANRTDAFQIKRGVKQGDVLSSVLFDCILDFAMAKWKRRIPGCGIVVRDPDERLANSRYADDILIYAKTLDEAVLMMEIFIEELSHIGLTLNAAKTRILHTWMPDPGHDMSFVDIAGDMVEILDIDACHTYLGKHLILRVDERLQLEVKHRIHQAWEHSISIEKSY